MAKRFLTTLLALIMLAAAAGCASPFQLEYHYSEPYAGEDGGRDPVVTEINNYKMLRNAILEIVNKVGSGGQFKLSNYEGDINSDLAAACFEIKSDTAIGAFAVDTLSYEVSQIVSYYTADIYVTYKRTAGEIKSIAVTSGIGELSDHLLQGFEERSERMTLQVYSPTVTEDYITEYLHRLYLDEPLVSIVEPAVKVDAYPESGYERIFDIALDYHLDDTELRRLETELNQRLDLITGGITEGTPVSQAYDCASYLIKNCQGGDIPAAYPGTAYGALNELCSDSKSLSLAYKALCDRLGIECTVVEGSKGALGAYTDHFWNIVTLFGECYHVDVSEMLASGAERAFLLSDEQMWGAYIWDTDAYTACTGSMSYSSEKEETPVQPVTPTPQVTPEIKPPEDKTENVENQ